MMPTRRNRGAVLDPRHDHDRTQARDVRATSRPSRTDLGALTSRAFGSPGQAPRARGNQVLIGNAVASRPLNPTHDAAAAQPASGADPVAIATGLGRGSSSCGAASPRRSLPEAIRVRAYRIAVLVFAAGFIGVLSVITLIDEGGQLFE